MEQSKKNKIDNIFHKSFEIGILIKGINGILEIIGGILFIFLSPYRLNNIIGVFTQSELSEDPKDIIANYLIKLSSTFTISTQYFGFFYLVSHGLIKVFLVILLWKRKIWAYPLTIIILTLFIIYQIYRYTITNSIELIVLSVLDIIVIFLTFIEYQRIKNLFIK